MSFRTRIFAVLAAVGLLPVVLLGYLSFSVNRAELERTVGSAQESIAQEAARGAEHAVARGIDGLRLSLGMLPFDQLTTAEVAAALHIPYGQLQVLDALALLDEDGKLAAPLVAEPRPAPRKPFAAADLPVFLRHAPLGLAMQAGTALGPPYRQSDGASRVAVAVRVSSSPLRVAAAQFSLGELQQSMREIAPPGGLALLANGDKGALATSGAELTALGPDAPALLKAAATAHGPVTRVLQSSAGEWVASASPVGGLGWTAVVAQPATVAFGPALRVKRYTVFWAGAALVLTLVLGLLVARSLTGPVDQLKKSAKALQDGDYAAKIEVTTRDELGELAHAFGHMAKEIRRRDDEIRTWNAELQKRVEDRSLELKAAQDQILRTRRLAAIGSLGAGIAHEINNPLMAIGGYLAMLKKQGDPKSGALADKAGEQVQRVARIVDGLLQFASQERAVAGRRFSLAETAREVLGKHQADLEQAKIDLHATLHSSREAEGDPVQIAQVIDHLVRNAIQAMPAGGKLNVGLLDVGEDSLRLTVQDTGKGIPSALRERIFDPFFSTKEAGKTGVGLGLSISHSIIEAHHGRILVDSDEGRGTTFTVVLPAAAQAAHLS